ncbi:MAG: DedA family protein [Candidatus Auribacterota bacterium]|nr:DedA family protein [Candidatus Auribacterota bacterium]
MLETVISYLSSVDTFWIYVILIAFSFTENIFPPSPSDVVVIVGALLIGTKTTTMSFIPVVLITAIASSLGFMVMYMIGKYLGEHILRTGKIKFISQEAIEKSTRWFSRYGYKLIVSNRFLPGTRSVISFFSGMNELKPVKTFFCATLSALLWNSLIIYLGIKLGDNVDLIDHYLSTYRNIILITMGVIAVILIIRYLIIRAKKNSNQ